MSTSSTESPIQRSAMVGVEAATIAEIEEARVRVGAPEDARISTNVPGIEREVGTGQYFPASVMFTWFE